MDRVQKIAVSCVLMLALVACGHERHQLPTASPTANPLEQPAINNLPFPTLSPTLLDLQHDYEALTAAHQVLSTIWEGLARGESARCGTPPTVPDPAGISAAGDSPYSELAAALRQAAIELTRSRELWQAECAAPRRQPPSAVINRGLLATRAAGDALRQASTLLPTAP
ncbi:MAG: hypothetical protein ACUVSU_02785 [Aggregatilineaceae bacterium]